MLSGIIKNGKSLNYNSILKNTIAILYSRTEDFNNRYDKLMNGYLNILYRIALCQKIKYNLDIEKLMTKLLNSTISPANRSIIYDIYLLVNEENSIKYFD